MGVHVSVTQVLRIHRFYDGMDEAPAANRMVGLARGSALHKAAHWLVLGHEPQWKGEDKHPELDRFLDGVRQCLRDHKIELIQHEAEWVNDEERVVSHPDWHVMIDGREALVEIKTGTMMKSVGLQVCGQMIAGMKSVRDVSRVALNLPGNGRYSLIPLMDYRQYAEFRCLLQTVHIMEKYQGYFWRENGDAAD